MYVCVCMRRYVCVCMRRYVCVCMRSQLTSDCIVIERKPGFVFSGDGSVSKYPTRSELKLTCKRGLQVCGFI